MPLKFHPKTGTIVIYDFRGFIAPEMVKRRPAIVVSPKFRRRADLCTIVPFSTKEPTPLMPYHYRLQLDTPLPHPYASPTQWVKGDMLCTVSFNRLSLPYVRKGEYGKRIYEVRVIEGTDFIEIKKCVLNALGMTGLISHL